MPRIADALDAMEAYDMFARKEREVSRSYCCYRVKVEKLESGPLAQVPSGFHFRNSALIYVLRLHVPASFKALVELSTEYRL